MTARFEWNSRAKWAWLINMSRKWTCVQGEMNVGNKRSIVSPFDGATRQEHVEPLVIAQLKAKPREIPPPTPPNYLHALPSSTRRLERTSWGMLQAWPTSYAFIVWRAQEINAELLSEPKPSIYFPGTREGVYPPQVSDSFSIPSSS